MDSSSSFLKGDFSPVAAINNKTSFYPLYKKPFINNGLWTTIFVVLIGLVRFGHLARGIAGLSLLICAEVFPLLLVLTLVRKERRMDLGFKRFHFSWWFISIGTGLVLGAALALFNRFLLPPSWDWIVAMGRTAIPADLRGLPWIWIDSAFILIGGIMTPLSEEFFFRGVVISGWLKGNPERIGGRLVVVVVVQALIFAFLHLAHTGVEILPFFALHLPRAINIFTSTFLGGLMFAFVRIRSGSIWPAVLAHASVNAAAALL